jgi:hypothetical protein
MGCEVGGMGYSKRRTDCLSAQKGRFLVLFHSLFPKMSLPSFSLSSTILTHLFPVRKWPAIIVMNANTADATQSARPHFSERTGWSFRFKDGVDALEHGAADVRLTAGGIVQIIHQ